MGESAAPKRKGSGRTRFLTHCSGRMATNRAARPLSGPDGDCSAAGAASPEDVDARCACILRRKPAIRNRKSEIHFRSSFWSALLTAKAAFAPSAAATTTSWTSSEGSSSKSRRRFLATVGFHGSFRWNLQPSPRRERTVGRSVEEKGRARKRSPTPYSPGAAASFPFQSEDRLLSRLTCFGRASCAARVSASPRVGAAHDVIGLSL